MKLNRLIQTLCLTLHGVYNIKGDSTEWVKVLCRNKLQYTLSQNILYIH